MNDAGQLVLRFRDIERPLGETVRLHRKVIDEQGWTWWGWLYRSYERVPTEVFDLVSADVSVDSPIEVFLYDTGQALVHSANCMDASSSNVGRGGRACGLEPLTISAKESPPGDASPRACVLLHRRGPSSSPLSLTASANTRDQQSSTDRIPILR